MGMGQERTGAQLTPSSSNTPERLSNLRESILTTIMDWKLIIAVVKGGR